MIPLFIVIWEVEAQNDSFIILGVAFWQRNNMMTFR